METSKAGLHSKLSLMHAAFRGNALDMSSNRDEFSPKTKLQLAQRVGHICSNPDCMEHTVGPTTEETGVSNTGKACHIHAAAPGGPRFEVSMSEQERKAIRNGIWLCGSCATKVDNDADAFPPDMLQKWKRDAEFRARKRQGQPILTDAGAQKQMESVFSAAPHEFSLNALSNALRAAELHLSKLDERFHVSIAKSGRGTTFALTAKASAAIQMKFVPKDPTLANVELSNLVAHGGSARFAVEHFALDGSPLLTRLLGSVNSGVLLLSSEHRQAALRLWLNMQDGRKVELFEMDGSVTNGRKTHTVAVKSFDDAFTLSVQAPNAPGEAESLQLQYGLDLTPWDGRNVKRLAGVEPLRTLFAGILDGARLMAEAFVGELSIWSMDITPTDQVFAGQQFAVLAYAHYARTLSNHLDIALKFVSDHSFDSDEFFEVAQTAGIADGSATGEVQGDISATVTWDSAMDLQSMAGTDTPLRFEEHEGRSIQVYGQAVIRPPVKVEVDVVFPPVDPKHSGPQTVVMKPVAGTIARYAFMPAPAPVGATTA